MLPQSMWQLLVGLTIEMKNANMNTLTAAHPAASTAVEQLNTVLHHMCCTLLHGMRQLLVHYVLTVDNEEGDYEHVEGVDAHPATK
jgi:hypothetical protein